MDVCRWGVRGLSDSISISLVKESRGLLRSSLVSSCSCIHDPNLNISDRGLGFSSVVNSIYSFL